MAKETINHLLTTIQAALKRRKGIDRTLTEPRFKALHDLCVQFNAKEVRAQLITETRFVVIDTETTGFHAYSGDEIVSISLLEMQGFELTGREYQTLVNPGRPIPKETTAIHGLRDEDVANYPRIQEILCDVIEFMDKSVIVGHHVNFDIRFLNKSVQKQLFCSLPHLWIDTMLLYVAFAGQVGHYTLDEVAEVCHVNNPGRHSAHGDALATAMIFQKLGTRLSSENSRVADLVKLQYEVGQF